MNSGLKALFQMMLPLDPLEEQVRDTFDPIFTNLSGLAVTLAEGAKSDKGRWVGRKWEGKVREVGIGKIKARRERVRGGGARRERVQVQD